MSHGRRGAVRDAARARRARPGCRCRPSCRHGRGQASASAASAHYKLDVHADQATPCRLFSIAALLTFANALQSSASVDGPDFSPARRTAGHRRGSRSSRCRARAPLASTARAIRATNHVHSAPGRAQRRASCTITSSTGMVIFMPSAARREGLLSRRRRQTLTCSRIRHAAPCRRRRSRCRTCRRRDRAPMRPG